MVSGILEDSSKRLEKLELNNLLQFSEIEPPVPKFTTADDFHAYWKVYGEGHKAIPRTRLMAGVTDTLLGRCPVLTSLCITTFGEGHYLLRDSVWQDDRYSSWATFLHSVRGQLCYLSFKQGVNRESDSFRLLPHQTGRPSSIYRNIGERFRQWILPVLIEAPWPRIKRMEFKGVGSSMKVPNVT
jgi:hypothetical protein